MAACSPLPWIMSIFLFLRRALFAMPFHLSPLSPISASCLGAEARAHFISRREGSFQEVGGGVSFSPLAFAFRCLWGDSIFVVGGRRRRCFRCFGMLA